MRSISLLTLLVFSLIGTTYGDVTITAKDAGGGKLRIGYQTTGALAPVAFALDIQLSNGATFSNVTPLTQRYYYPGNFRDYINAANPNWEDPHYLPLAPAYDIGALGGLGASGLTIEMASMLNPYLASNSKADFDADGLIDTLDLDMFSEQWLIDGGIADLDNNGFVDFQDYAVFLDGHFDPIPTLSGDLLLFQLNGNGAEMTMANISLNLIRGGIVLEDAFVGTAILPTQVQVIIPEPATLLLLGLGGLVLQRKK
jgi:hypothetical protein